MPDGNWRVSSLPVRSSVVWAWSPDHPAPLHGASGGDFSAAVELVASVPSVRVLQGLGDELQAVAAAGYLVGFIGVDSER